MKGKNWFCVSFVFFLSFLMLLLICPGRAFSQGGHGTMTAGGQSSQFNTMMNASMLAAQMGTWAGSALAISNWWGMESGANFLQGMYNTMAPISGMSQGMQTGNWWGNTGVTGGLMRVTTPLGRVANWRRALNPGGRLGRLGIRVNRSRYRYAGMLNMGTRLKRESDLFKGGIYGRRKTVDYSFRNRYSSGISYRVANQRLLGLNMRRSLGLSLFSNLGRASLRYRTAGDKARKRKTGRSLDLY